MDARPRQALLVVNRNAAQGSAVLDPALQRLRAGGVEITELTCRSREEVAGRVVEAAGGADCVIVAGGDGALNAAAPALLETGLALGVLPLGTANDLARTLGIPDDLEQAAAVIARGATRRIDLGLANGLPFFNVASFGLSGAVTCALSSGQKQRFGRFSYVLAGVRVLLRARPFEAEIVDEKGRVRVTTFQIAVGSGRYYGGGMAVRTDAEIDDGRLDLYSLEASSVWKLVLMAPWFRRGTHGAWREVRAERSVAFRVDTRLPLPVDLDGELLTRTPAAFDVLPGAVQVYRP